MDTVQACGGKQIHGRYVFQSKTLLELGAGHGQIGNAFHTLGAMVTSSDARKEYVENIKQAYPHLETVALDADKDTIPKKYDIIVHWGLLYHLAEIEEHLEDVSKKCDICIRNRSLRFRRS